MTDTKLFCVSGFDKPGHLEARLANREAHLAHWGALGDDLVFGGPYLDDDGNPNGSLIVIKAESLAAAEALVSKDPYQTNGVFETVSVRRWVWFVKAPEGL